MNEPSEDQLSQNDLHEPGQTVSQPKTSEAVVMLSVVFGIMLLRTLFAGPSGSS